MSIAARGALNHQVTAEEGKVARYRLQVPSAWNFGPAVNGQRGIVEQALIGTSVESLNADASSPESSIEIGRIVRSFDPCLACAIH
jgi:Ni,Fe-hydrogenase I large subunit